jgi:predicted permease
VVCQISLAFVLLIGSALLTISFLRVLSVDPGFKAQGVLTASVSLPGSRYPDDKQFRAFVERFGQALRGIPGATQAGLTSFLPFAGGSNASVITIEGYTLGKGEVPPVPAWNTMDEGYLQAMRIPLLRGRNFALTDTKESQRVVIIDDYLARKYWPGRDPIGQKIRRGIDRDDAACTIIGIVGNVKATDLADVKPNGQIYFYYKQFSVGTVNAVVRTAGDPGALAQVVRRELLRIDPELPLARVLTMEERIDRSLRGRRAAMVVCLIFAGLALVLSAIGIYGVLAYAVTQRTREFGIRVALGASARDVLGMVAGQGMKLAVIGLAVGVAGAFALTRLMTALLYGVKPTDPAIFLLMAAALMSVAVVASLIPSLRAVRIRPAVALRYE